jgi:hypothetical protein
MAIDYMLLNAVLGATICRDHVINLLVDYGLDIDATHHGLSLVVPYPPLGESYHFHWIGLRANLQETMVFTIKYRAFL